MVWKRNEVMKQENRLDSDESRRFLWSGQWESNNGNSTGTRKLWSGLNESKLFLCKVLAIQANSFVASKKINWVKNWVKIRTAQGRPTREPF